MIKRRSRRPGRKSLRFESLENRQLLAGLVSWWTADNTAADAVGVNHGTLVSGATYTAGQVGQAFRFDGIDDRVQVTDSESLKLTASMTIEAWVRADADSPTAGGPILFRGDDRGGLDPYVLTRDSNNTIRFGISPSNNQGVSIGAPMPIGQFFHVAATLDDATGAMRLYINGVLKAQTVTSVRPFGDLDPAYNPSIGIGNHGGWPTTPHNFPFHGLIDELKVYDIALSQAEVQASFNAKKGDLQPTISISNASFTEGDRPVNYSGNLVDSLAGLVTPYQMIHGPDGHLYVSTFQGSSVLRFDAVSGLPLPAPGKTGAEFVTPYAGGLNTARSIAFGPDGNLYVASQWSDEVLRFDGTTGDPLGALVTSGSGGLDHPRGILFHTDGYLYVCSVGGAAAALGRDSILRFDATSGAPAGVSGQPGNATFISSGSGGLDNPSQIVFENGSFYVASMSPSTSNSVLRYGTNGSFLGAFVTTGSGGLAGPADLAFRGGFLYVVSSSNNKVLRYNGATGAFVDELISDSGLFAPLGLLFDANGNVLVTSRDTNEIRRYGDSSDAIFTINLSAPFPTPVSVSYATLDVSASADNDYTPVSGTAEFEPGQWQKVVRVPILDDAFSEATETFVVNLSSPTGGLITDGQGVGTINDDEMPPTKFYVVDDASQNRTFEYTAAETLVESYSVNSGNSAPRGVAASLAGDKIWVVDANRKVYVYNTTGGSLGSWMAGTLANKAKPEGVTTNGTDIWIVDGRSDKIYEYANAASLVTGAPTANSFFALASGNTNPKDIVTDGQSLWVVDDGAKTDKVFKYTLSGSLVGSWTIATSGATSPTGITLDPAAPSDLWIVDNGTDRVYQYTDALLKTSGSLAAAASFLLAPGNANPQGIADPPAPGAAVSGAPASSAPVELADLAFASLSAHERPSQRLWLSDGVLGKTNGAERIPLRPPLSVSASVNVDHSGTRSWTPARRPGFEGVPRFADEVDAALADLAVPFCLEK
jgi:hypothetical protein